MRVCHYRCYAADQRISMQIYANALQQALSDSSFKLEVFTPVSSLERYYKNRMVMRWLRYIDYPLAVRNVRADIHHIVDHGYAHLLPNLNGGKRIITVHDLIPMLTWKGVIEKAGQQRKPVLNLRSLSYLNRYDRIITPSISTANDLQEYLNIAPELIEVIPPIIAEWFTRASDKDVQVFRTKYNLNSASKWIMISGREYYKNHRTCLKILKEILSLTKQPIAMVKTGLPCAEFDKMVVDLGLKGQVRTIYLRDEQELPILYSTVDCLLFPSFYEGFGMPVAESLACGTPVVSSDRGSLAEVGGDLTLKFKPDDVTGMASAIHEIITRPAVSEKLALQGPDSVQHFRSRTGAKKLIDLYTSLA